MELTVPQRSCTRGWEMSLQWLEPILSKRPKADGHSCLANPDIDDMTRHHASCLRHRAVAACLLASAIALPCACSDKPAAEATPVAVPRVAAPQRVELLSGGSMSLNYTPWYIHTWELAGPAGSGIGGGGPNVMPIQEDGRPSGGGAETCCTSIPHDWQPNLGLTVRWLVDKKQDGKTPGYWYKAENVRFGRYDGRQVGAIWAVFLPGDRVRLMVSDGNSSGSNDLNHQPPDSDPYIAQGVLDDEWNRLYRKGENAQ
jgi:hypothetical protein